MGILFDEVSNIMDKEGLGGRDIYTPTYRTGIDILDYRAGRFENDEIKLGLDGGKIITIIGKSGTGKSTLGLQIGLNMIKDYENGMMIHFDYEGAATEARVKDLSGWTDDEIKKKYMIRNVDIYSETLYSTVKALEKLKCKPEMFDKIKVDSGSVDENGNPIYVLPPTVILVDSWACVVPKEISTEEELSGSMSASSIAKTNNAVIKRIPGILKKANITLIIINHITKKIEIGFAKTQADVNYLKNDETIPG